MRFSTALISILVLPSIALASLGAHVSSSVGAGTTTKVEANSKDVALPMKITITRAAAAVSSAESSSNNKEKISVDPASAAKKDTHSATTSANAETSVKLDTSGMNSILSTENPSLRSSASETTSHDS
ncbi:hypothetical protein PENSOL_c001G07974 [Penicillium solitum]|uniref:Uncharacterized protein n=1 Tax=Penicillium solitum TaxID=60172 RepID=A0A1V6RPY3_9EURO|nr:uncharacterized protein PENSOL_c001G07974 [Penicillium solitum]OQE03716.1 hypothetical protein PENSOL_c001G07974 [Penicillium solitum]